MPELPEVEITRRRVEPVLVGRRIVAVHTTAPSYFFITAPAELADALRDRTTTQLQRRGKYLLAALDDGATLVLHLGMTGQLFARGATSPRLVSATSVLAQGEQRRFGADQHTHLVLEFANGEPALLFRDVRKFGKVALLPAGEPLERLTKLGPDALSVDAATLHAAADKRRTAIKTLLLDQAVLAGVGNIYADEALFRAGVRPTSAANSLSLPRLTRIAAEVRAVLAESIERGGSTIDDFVHPDGTEGHFQDGFAVYGRAGEPCRRCGSLIERVVLAQRSTHYCRKCQRA